MSSNPIDITFHFGRRQIRLDRVGPFFHRTGDQALSVRLGGRVVRLVDLLFVKRRLGARLLRRLGKSVAQLRASRAPARLDIGGVTCAFHRSPLWGSRRRMVGWAIVVDPPLIAIGKGTTVKDLNKAIALMAEGIIQDLVQGSKPGVMVRYEESPESKRTDRAKSSKRCRREPRRAG